jgi:short subunit dehydrogenase-like uncharacterized protein
MCLYLDYMCICLIMLFFCYRERNHLKIVQACGMDCIPADLGVFMMVEEMKKMNLSPSEVRLFMEDAKGTLSTGTMASLIEIFESSSTWEILSMASPYYLNPRDEKHGRPIVPHDRTTLTLRASDNAILGYDFTIRSWTAPYLMQFVDTRIVNRSNALQNWAYGKEFVFVERMKMRNIFMAFILSIIIGIFNLFLINPISRKVAKFFLPAKSKAPDQQTLEEGFFKMLLVAKGRDQSGQKDVIIKGRINAMQGDPGYK